MPTRTLFIGNSFTARNNVPGLIEAMARARGQKFSCKLLSIGGASLRTHFNRGEALEAIRSGKFTSVVLQEQSTLPVKNAVRMHENVRLFDAPIREAGAEMVLYLTWARRHAPQSQAAITEAYAAIGRELGAKVAPAGVAWERVLADHPLLTLHDKDQSHPTLPGSYLAACVLYGTLMGQSPVGAPAPAALNADTAAALQQAAHDTLKQWSRSEPGATHARRPAPKPGPTSKQANQSAAKAAPRKKTASPSAGRPARGKARSRSRPGRGTGR